MKKANASIAKKSLRALVWVAATALFCGALLGGAKIGTNAGLARLPDSARRGFTNEFPLDVEIVLGSDGEPVFLSRSVQALRDFFFTHPAADSRRAAETEATQLRRFVGEIRARTVRQDADLMNVEIRSGALNGDSYWMHVSQLPKSEEVESKSLPDAH